MYKIISRKNILVFSTSTLHCDLVLSHKNDFTEHFGRDSKIVEFTRIYLKVQVRTDFRDKYQHQGNVTKPKAI